ncbi:L-lysine 2,3-aminomutase [subsurface metagenome]
MTKIANSFAQSGPRAEACRPPIWQQELARAFTRVPDLLAELGLEKSSLNGVAPATEMSVKQFPMRVPRGFARRMRHGDPEDPLLLQVLARPEEAEQVADFVADPVGDQASVRTAGVLQKYRGRALLIVTGACAIHCRYCFRRAFPYAENSLTASRLDEVIEEFRQDTSLDEVILSGGDPLSLSNARLEAILRRLNELPHIKRIRIHTRLPIALPERVDSDLTKVLAGVTRPLIIVLHCNHANEIDKHVSRAATTLATCSSQLLNQSVLLRRVNDSVRALTDLSESLFRIGVLPYYLHQLDPVAGAAHFQVMDEAARLLVGEVAKRLPGYLVPRLARELAGEPAKLLLSPLLHKRSSAST